MPDINLLESIEDTGDCYRILSQLHPNISYNQFKEVTQRLYDNGYRLISLSDKGKIRAVAGVHIAESYAWKRYLYIDDLVTDESVRSMGHGKTLLEWIKEYAKSNNCEQLHLDSRVIRHSTHKFYLNNKLIIDGYHFHTNL